VFVQGAVGRRGATRTSQRRWLSVAAGMAVLALTTVWVSSDPGIVAADAAGRPPIRVYGQAASFMFLNAEATTGSGHLAVGIPVSGWRYSAITGKGWRKGTSAWFAERTSNGRIVIGTMPLTINQTKSTMKTMSVAVFDPATETFNAIKVPTDKPADPVTHQLTYEAAFPGKSGGADVSDLCVVDVDPDPGVTEERVLAISYLPYKNWNPATFGKFPGLLYLKDDGTPGAASLKQDRARSKIPEEVRATMPPAMEATPPAIADLTFPLKPNPILAYGPYASTVGANECAVLPSGDIVVTQYGLDTGHFPGSESGRLIVLGPDGTVKDFLQLENYETAMPVRAVPLNKTAPYVAAAGTPLRMLPREVQADPGTSPDGTQRVTVLYDALIKNGTALDQAPFPIQEFSWDGSHLRATSAPVEVSDATGVPLDLTAKQGSFSRLAYAPDGTLFAAQVFFNGAAGGGPFAEDLVAFARGTLDDTPPVDPAPGAPRTDFGTEAIPDLRIDAATWAPSFPPANRPIRSTRSILFDGAGQRLYTVSWRGEMRAYAWHGTSVAPTVMCDVDLGVTKLVKDPNNDRIVQGVLDPVARTMYVPYERRGKKLPDEIVDQYLFAVDVDDVVNATRASELDVSSCDAGAVDEVDLAIAASATTSFEVGSTGSYLVQVTNHGPSATSGPISVTTVLPAGLTFVSGSGTGWSCDEELGVVTCAYTDPLPVDADAPDLTFVVDVDVAAEPEVTSTFEALAEANREDDASNNTAVVVTPVAGDPSTTTTSTTSTSTSTSTSSTSSTTTTEPPSSTTTSSEPTTTTTSTTEPPSSTTTPTSVDPTSSTTSSTEATSTTSTPSSTAPPASTTTSTLPGTTTVPETGGPIDVGAQPDPDPDGSAEVADANARAQEQAAADARVRAERAEAEARAAAARRAQLPVSGSDAVTPSYTGLALILAGIGFVILAAWRRGATRQKSPGPRNP
jgi:hypothetical protein